METDIMLACKGTSYRLRYTGCQLTFCFRWYTFRSKPWIFVDCHVERSGAHQSIQSAIDKKETEYVMARVFMDPYLNLW